MTELGRSHSRDALLLVEMVQKPTGTKRWRQDLRRRRQG
jgi:hypothetical protein